MQPEHATWLLMAAIFCPLICGTLSLLIPRPYILPRLLLILCGPIGALLMLSHFTFHSGVGGATAYVEWMPLLHLDIALKPDHLGLFFAYLVSGIGVCIVLYARGYFGKDADSLFRFYPYLMIFMTALIGVAPYLDRSGRTDNRRHIKAGRRHARSALYMAALCALRYNPVWKAFYDGLVRNGKPGKVALTALMRKIAITINIMIAKEIPWAPPTRPA